MSATEKYLTNTTKTYQMIREYIIYMNLFAYNKVAFKKPIPLKKLWGSPGLKLIMRQSTVSSDNDINFQF